MTDGAADHGNAAAHSSENDRATSQILAAGWTKSIQTIATELQRFATIAQVAFEAIEPGLKAFAAAALQIAKALPELLATLPPNIRALGAELDLRRLMKLASTEGLQFAYVPPAPVVSKLLAAADAAARRQIIRSNSRSILNSCESELAMVERAELLQYVSFAQHAAAALRAGFRDASQALSANLLDTIIAGQLGPMKRMITDQKSKPNVDEFSVRVALTVSGIWSAHGQYFPAKGDLIPRSFSRHGSVHGVSRRQYTLVNATVALMHVVALLRLLDSQPEVVRST